MAEPDELREIERWFADRGFRLAFHEVAGETWVDLVRGSVAFERFGGGHGARSELEAARAAQRRYRYQEEPPAPPPRRLP